MFTLTLLVASIAIADSINPSTIVPALWLASTRGGQGLGSYTLGVFAVYLAGGVVLIVGPGPALIATLRDIGGPVEHGVEVGAGVAALAFAIALWSSRHEGLGQRQPAHRPRNAGAFTLGAAIMALELPTAFMYFGAISAILTSRSGGVARVSLLLAYNALFVVPLLAILAVRHVAGQHADTWLASGELWLRRAGKLTLAVVAGATGAVLVSLGLGGLLG